MSGKAHKKLRQIQRRTQRANSDFVIATIRQTTKVMPFKSRLKFAFKIIFKLF